MLGLVLRCVCVVFSGRPAGDSCLYLSPGEASPRRAAARRHLEHLTDEKPREANNPEKNVTKQSDRFSDRFLWFDWGIILLNLKKYKGACSGSVSPCELMSD